MRIKKILGGIAILSLLACSNVAHAQLNGLFQSLQNMANNLNANNPQQQQANPAPDEVATNGNEQSEEESESSRLPDPREVNDNPNRQLVKTEHYVWNPTHKGAKGTLDMKYYDDRTVMITIFTTYGKLPGCDLEELWGKRNGNSIAAYVANEAEGDLELYITVKGNKAYIKPNSDLFFCEDPARYHGEYIRK